MEFKWFAIMVIGIAFCGALMIWADSSNKKKGAPPVADGCWDCLVQENNDLRSKVDSLTKYLIECHRSKPETPIKVRTN